MELNKEKIDRIFWKMLNWKVRYPLLAAKYLVFNNPSDLLLIMDQVKTDIADDEGLTRQMVDIVLKCNWPWR